MRSSKRTAVSLNSTAQQPADPSIGTELNTAWKSLAQSKPALRHIENHLEAGPGTTVVMESVMDPPKKNSSRTVRCRDGQQVDDNGGSSKYRGHRQLSPKKSSSRSPLRNATQDSNVRKNNSVEFREPLATYREATPSPHPSTQLEAQNLQSVPGSSYPSSPPPSDPLLSQLVYQIDTRDKQTDRDLESTHSSALESTEDRYLNDQQALETVANQSHSTSSGFPAREWAKEDSNHKAQFNQSMEDQESSPCSGPALCTRRRGESTPSTSPGSASQRLENLRRHQPDDKLEKLKERIRRQRQHLEEAAEKERLFGSVEQPKIAAARNNNGDTNNMPRAIVRKVAAAPPAPTYKGFNISETRIRTPDGKVLKEADFHKFSREMHGCLSWEFAECTRSRHQQQKEQRADTSKERRTSKPVRKVHRAPPTSDLNAKPVISPASWREGQKVVKTVLGSAPKLPREDRPQPDDRLSRTASRHRSSSDPRRESQQRSRSKSTDRSRSARQGHVKSHHTTTSTHTSVSQDKAPVGLGTDLLSEDIQGILEDLQLECKAAEKDERARQRTRRGNRGRGGSVSRTRTPISAWGTAVATASSSRGCRSASPATNRSESTNMADTGQKRRHYDVNTVRHYIAKQQEERKRHQAEEKRALRDETERRNQRLQELYRRQREVAKTVFPSEATVAPVQKRLQETYNKLLLEEAQLCKEATQSQPAAPFSQVRPMYQPSGESDKENKRLEPPQSPSSSDRSLNDQPTSPLTRNGLDVGVASLFQPDSLSPAVQPTTVPSSSALVSLNEHLLSQLLRLEPAVLTGDIKHTHQLAQAPSNKSQSKKSRIEALKATAASLSSRVESEARKFAGEGINYGTATSMDTVLTSRSSQAKYFHGPSLDDGRWAETAAHAATENNDMASRIQRSTGHSSYNGTALPGTDNMDPFRVHKEKNGTHTIPQTTSADVKDNTPNSYAEQRGNLHNGLENANEDKGEKRTDLHDSSAGSISEGPLLSEGSLSEDDASPPHPSNHRVPRPADCLEALDSHVGQRRDYHRLSEFQKEAAKCSSFSSTIAQRDSGKAAWEELNKGSPLSVINVFIKNIQCQLKVNEKNSPSVRSLHSGNSPGDAAVYEDDFVSSHSSGASGPFKRGSKSHSVNSHFEELMRRSPYEKNTGDFNSHHSSFHSSLHSPHLSSSGSSPLSKHSARKSGSASDQSAATLLGDEKSSCSPQSKVLSADSRKRSSDISSAHTVTSGHSHQSFRLDGKTSTAVRPRLASPSGSPPEVNSPCEPLVGPNYMNTGISDRSGRAETRATASLLPEEAQYSPAVLQQRMAAELQYLDSIEESVRQLGDVERLMDVSMAQQDSAAFIQKLKAKQQRHERDLYELKIKAERESLEAQLQLEENRQRMAMAHIELQESFAVRKKESLEGLQDATTKMMSQQAEAAQYTADAARHIKEMTELARSQIAGALAVAPIATDSSMLSKHQLEHKQSSYKKHLEENSYSESFQSEGSSRKNRPEEPGSLLNSLSYSSTISRPPLSGTDSSLHSPSPVSAHHIERVKKVPAELKWRKGEEETRTEGKADNSSIEEEVPIAANDSICSDSIPSAVDEKGETTSIATEYSLEFDESMTEDEIEERSFRSLLPSEALRRGTLEKRPRHHEESEDDATDHNSMSVSGAQSILKNANIAFSGGQDSFSQFTMDMVRQYMKDEDVRLQHQSSLLGLRKKALKEKIRTELAWLEHQKKQLRDKGEDDKMPPIRKKQRGLLMRLQQEQAEIKRLQEANKAARKERQLLLKQQEEIERMRSSTLKLKERLKCAGCEASSETPVLETAESEAATPDMRHADIRTPSPSPSISGSETSSIMQKLKKMRSHMDEKFLTKKEQQLMHRRRHAEKLLQWKKELDQEEAEVRRIEKEALAGRNKDHVMSESQKKDVSDISPSSSHHRSSEPRTDNDKEYASEGDCSSATPESSIHTEGQGSEQQRSPSSVQLASVLETPSAFIKSSPANFTQDFHSASPSPSRQSSAFKDSHSPAASPYDGSSKTKMQLRSSSQITNQAQTQPTDTPMATQTEPISDQSDIESRIKALKEELRKRKFMAYQLKKEQKKKNLKAQEASLLQQLQVYNIYIEKTKAELNKERDSTQDTKSQNKDSSSVSKQSRIKPLSPRSETSKIYERTQIDSSLDYSAPPQPDHNRSTSAPEELSDEDTPTVTPTPVYGSVECATSGLKNRKPSSKEAPITESGDENIVSDQRSCIREELEVDVSYRFEDQDSGRLLKLDMEDRNDSQEKLSASENISAATGNEHPSVSLEQNKQIKKKDWSESEELVQSTIIASSKPLAAEVETKTSHHQSCDPLLSDRSCSRDSNALSSKEEALIKDVETSSHLADSYNDDLESSCESSPKEGKHISEHASQFSIKDDHSRAMPFDMKDEEVEEEQIEEELSHHSGSSGASHESGRLLDLGRQTEDFKPDSKSINSSHSPPASPIQSPHSPVTDEMPRFNIGDRVLVGGVQPGTLRFKGSTIFANGFWAGVELDKSEGSNNGSYDGVVYFECVESHGIFAPPDKITHLPDRFESYTEMTEDEDSFFDDLADKSGDKRKTEAGKSPKQANLKTKDEETYHESYKSRDKNLTDEPVHLDQHLMNQDPPKAGTHLNSQHYKQPKLQISNGKSRDIMVNFEDVTDTLFITDKDRNGRGKESKEEITPLVEKEDVDSKYQFTLADISTDVRDDGEQTDGVFVDTITDKLLTNFVEDAVKQLTQIKKAKEQKIEASNQINGDLFENDEEAQISSVDQKDGLPFFLTGEQEELSSPELCNRPESPVLGASGQEELAKRLAELELSRELLDGIDDQDWFDEDFGLSSRREQQRLEQKQREEEEGAKLGGGLRRSGSSAGEALGALVLSPDGDQQIMTPPRPALPLPLPPKLPEQPAMVVPHSATEVQKIVHAAIQEIWESCGLANEGTPTLANLPCPKPSQEYLGKESSPLDQESLCIHSYKKAVFDLTWEILQDIYAEEPNTEQPQWVKSRRVKSSFFHRVKTPGDISQIKEFVTVEVLKLYGLAKDQSQKTDWQKMLKFGRKKRDRVDHILVQELHEEEVQWVNYDEDELFVKMQLADSIFDALLKDTVNTLNLISDKRAKSGTLS